MVVLLSKVSNLLKAWALLRAQWSKPKPQPALIDFNREAVLRTLQGNWTHLYERKGEDSWKLLMGQLERIRNIYILDACRKGKDIEAYWRHMGRIEALESFHSTVHSEMSRLKKESDSQGTIKNNETKIAGPKSRRQRSGVPISL